MTIALAVGCHTTPLRQPPGVPPTEPSVTREEPGGDANDPHASALRRLLSAGWGWRNDKQDAFHVPLPDWQNWRRIRYFGVPSFVGFRYGDDHHAVIAIWVRDADEGVTPDQCLEAFEQWARPTAREFNVSITSPNVTRARWPDPTRLAGSLLIPATSDAGVLAAAAPATTDAGSLVAATPDGGELAASAGDGGSLDPASFDGGTMSSPAPALPPSPAYAPPTPPVTIPVFEPTSAGSVVVKSVDAEVTALFSKKSYAAAYAAYTVWPKTCTIFGIAVPMRESGALAREVRDRYVSDGFWRMEQHRQDVPQH